MFIDGNSKENKGYINSDAFCLGGPKSARQIIPPIEKLMLVEILLLFSILEFLASSGVPSKKQE